MSSLRYSMPPGLLFVGVCFVANAGPSSCDEGKEKEDEARLYIAVATSLGKRFLRQTFRPTGDHQWLISSVSSSAL